MDKVKEENYNRLCNLIHAAVKRYGKKIDDSQEVLHTNVYYCRTNTLSLEQWDDVSKGKVYNRCFYIKTREKKEYNWETLWDSKINKEVNNNLIMIVNHFLQQKMNEEIDKNKKQKIKSDKIVSMEQLAIKAKDILNIVNQLKEYEDSIIKIESNTKILPSNDGKIIKITMTSVILKHNNITVLNEVGNTGKYVSLYRPGGWEKYLQDVYEDKINNTIKQKTK